MEDPDEEWETEEYSEPKDGGNVRWILSKGLSLGKKVVVTGIVISSAPLVLPPLMVFSTLGLAFSVPFGLYFASYTCTQKLMGKLLSLPQPDDDPSMLEYRDEEEDIGQDMEFEGWTEKEKGYEEDDEDLAKENGKLLDDRDMRIEEPLMEVSMDEKPVGVVRGVEIVIAVDEELGGSIEVGKPFGVPLTANEGNKGLYKSKDIEEGEKLVKETRGLIEEIKDEANETVGQVEQPVKQTHGTAEEKDKNFGSVKQMESPVGDRNIVDTPRAEKPIHKKETKGKGILKENEKKRGRRIKGNNEIIPKVVKPDENIEGEMKKNMEENVADSNVKVEMPRGETKEMINSRGATGKEQKPTVDKKAMLGRTDDNAVVDADKDVRSGRKKDTAILSNVVIRKTEGKL